MMNLNLMIDPVIMNALREDMPFGDITTDALFTGEETGTARLVAKQDGVVSGLFVAGRVFELIDNEIVFEPLAKEGEKVEKGRVIANIAGRTASILKGERTALNFLQRMSGISTYTSLLCGMVAERKVKVSDTRKTLPGLRTLDKYAVKAGGGSNHRFSLSDGVMLKDNHIRAAGGISQAIRKTRESIPHTMKIEVETETLDQVREALGEKADIIMLDNMDIPMIREAVALINGQAQVEVSGNIDASNIREKALEGVDIISCGGLTHSVSGMDISLKFL
ncbi:MAG: carboxylating nicotinate-nucleotide diphosphorylase [Clostridia bacterium]